MMVTAYDNGALPAADRFAHWHDQMSQSLAATNVATTSADDFRASMRIVDLGAAQVHDLSLTSMQFHRSPKQIRDRDPEQVCAGLILSGRQALSQRGRDALPGLNDLVLYDSSHPHRGWVSSGRDLARNLVVQIPRSLLTLPTKRVLELTAVPLATHRGVTALLAQFMVRLSQDADLYRPADGPRLTTVLIDLLSAALAHELDVERALLPETHHRVLVLRIQAFVLQHLGDPELSPGVIAAVHQISIRQLHRLFEQQDMTIAAFIRLQRLERCCRDLADPALGSRTVHSISARWGFRRPADFTRSFRAAYGMPPSEYRALALPAAPARTEHQARKARQWAPTANDLPSPAAQDGR